jgi:chromosome partitioning protein
MGGPCQPRPRNSDTCLHRRAVCFSAKEEVLVYDQLVEAVEDAAKRHNFIVIDTPGHQSHITSLVHAMADTLVTPLNDSFVDFDVLAAVEPKTLELTGPSHYAEIVLHARNERSLLNQAPTDWIVLRNRLSMISSRNKRLMGENCRNCRSGWPFAASTELPNASSSASFTRAA